MLHALRKASPKAREARDAGFTLIEILVAMVLMTIVMSSLAVFFIGAQKSSSALRIRENATVIADQQMDKVHSIDPTKLLTGRDATTSLYQWQHLPTGVDQASMTMTSDTTAASGNGSNPLTTALPTTPQPVTTNNTTYSVNTIVGTCFIPRGGGNCTAADPGNSVSMDRVVVDVTWFDKGLLCPAHTCAYVIASLISPTVDPTFNVNQVVVDTTPPSTPTLGTCTTQGDQVIKVNAWSQSTDASGVARYDIYEGTTSVFANMTKDGSMTTTGPYTTTLPLVPNTPYFIAVVALDTVGNQSSPQVPVGTTTSPQQPYMISCTTAPDTFAPSVPVLTSPGSSTTSTTTFSWAASTDDYKMGGYQVYRNGTLLQNVSATTTSFTDTGLSPYVQYSYTVKAYDSYGNVSAASTPLVIRTTDTVAPTATTTLSATAKPWPALEIDLAWGAYTDDVATTGYTIYRSTSSTGPWNSTTLLTTTTTNGYADTAVAANTKYYYVVTAHDAVPNTSVNSNTANASTPDTIPPSAPTNVTAPSKTATTVTLTWTAATDNVGVTGYNIYRNGGTTPINSSAVTGLTFTDTGLTQLTAYSYTVKAYDAAGNISAASTSYGVTTLDGQPPTAPTVSSSAKTYTTVTLNWTTSTDNVGVTGYTVYRNGVSIGSTSNSVFTLTDTGLAPNTAYTYTVKAYDAAANYSVASNSLAVTTVADTTPPAKVTGVKGTSVAKNTVTISWSATTDNVAVATYQIYVGGTLNQTVASPTLSYYYPSGLANNSTYLITVYATDTSGNQSPVSATLTCVVSSTGVVTCT